MPQGKNDKIKRFLLGLLAFLGPIAVGAAAIEVGGYMAFWFLCYFLMLFIPVAFLFWLTYSYVVHISAEKVEDRLNDQGEVFLSALEERFDIIDGVVWDRSFRRRSRFSARRPFDKLAVSVSERWPVLSLEERQQLAEELSGMLRRWIKKNGVERRGHDIKVDFYYGQEDPSLEGKYSGGQLELFD